MTGHRIRGKMLRCCVAAAFTAVTLVGLVRIGKDLDTMQVSWRYMSLSNSTDGLRDFQTLPSFYNVPLRWESQSSEHKTMLITRRTCSHYYYLLILVSSAPGNLDRRNNIRKTWAGDSELKWPRWKTFFLLGQTPVQNVSESLLKEDEEYGDLVRANYIENYYNQTYKIQMGFEWAIKYCEFSFLLKVDDDVFVDGVAVISYLSEPSTPKKELYIGNLITWAMPVRKKDEKWSVSYDEYGETFYPDYCSGFGFILSFDVVALFVEMFDFLPFFKIDDAYVGMLAKETGIQARHSSGFDKLDKKSQNDSLCIPFVTTLVRHGILGECLVKIFNRSTTNRMYFF